ncbi:hypothetical protein [Leifsonia aquatica]|uniref:hypothetical protein n=1 Tax=Leifsonia aquatica TaxID=144185 RepID=UPI0012DF4F8D|nr:hypothetical protein [Leifsonia aquatica]
MSVQNQCLPAPAYPVVANWVMTVYLTWGAKSASTQWERKVLTSAKTNEGTAGTLQRIPSGRTVSKTALQLFAESAFMFAGNPQRNSGLGAARCLRDVDGRDASGEMGKWVDLGHMNLRVDAF